MFSTNFKHRFVEIYSFKKKFWTLSGKLLLHKKFYFARLENSKGSSKSLYLIQTSEHTLVAPVVNIHSMIFTSYSLQISVKLNRLWKIWPQILNGLRKRHCAFWAGFRKKEEGFHFFPDPVILINNEPSLNWKCFGLYVTRELIWRQTPNLCITVYWNKNILLLF